MKEDKAQLVVLEKIGSGGMGAVYHAKQILSDGKSRFVAVKALDPAHDKETAESLKKEFLLVRNLEHPNICQVTELQEKDGFLLMVMEYIDGRTLRQILDRMAKLHVSFTISEAVYICMQVAAALAYAHRCRDVRTGLSLNIVHRDISPQNIMITFKGEVKVIDFGVAKTSTAGDERTRTGIVKGKLTYMSPEQIKAEPLDGRSDIFSLGIILWELLTGRRLVDHSSPWEAAKRLITEEIHPPKLFNTYIPDDLNGVVMKMLARDPAERFQDAGEVNQVLTQFIHDNDAAFNISHFTKTIGKLFIEELDVRKAAAEGAPAGLSIQGVKSHSLENPFAGVDVDPSGSARPHRKHSSPSAQDRDLRDNDKQSLITIEPRRSALPYVFAVFLIAAFFFYRFVGVTGNSLLAHVPEFLKSSKEAIIKTVDMLKINEPQPNTKEAEEIRKAARAIQENQRALQDLANDGRYPAGLPSPTPNDDGQSFKSSVITLKNVVFDVTSIPTGASVFINGAKVSKTPAHVIVPETNRVRITLTLDGYEPYDDYLRPETGMNLKIPLQRRVGRR